MYDKLIYRKYNTHRNCACCVYSSKDEIHGSVETQIEALVRRMDRLEAEIARHRDREKIKFKKVCALLKRELGENVDKALTHVEQLAFRTWPLEHLSQGKIVWLANENSFFAQLPWVCVIHIFTSLGSDSIARLSGVAACFAFPQPNLDGAASVCTYCSDLAWQQFRIGSLGEVFRLSFRKKTNIAFESISGKSGHFLNENKEVVDIDGRCGLRILGNCVLQLPAPVRLNKEGWTISVWMHLPLTNRAWHNLLDGQGDDFIPVTFRNGVLGNYTLGKFTIFNARSLSDGWHHLAVVGDGSQGCTIYYVDGEVVGQHPDLSCGTIHTVGNRGDGQLTEAFTLMSDLRIFRIPASQQHVNKLANS